MSFLPVFLLYIHMHTLYFYLFIGTSKRFLGLILIYTFSFYISCARANSCNSISLFFPSWIQIDTEHVVETPKPCQVWILVLASPPGHISEINFEASGDMFQKSSRVVCVCVFLKVSYWLIQLTFIEHLLYISDTVPSDLHILYLLNLNSLQVNIPLFPFHRWGNSGLGKFYGPTLHS